MRTFTLLRVLALVVIPVTAGAAQDADEALYPTTAPSWLDFGIRGTSLSGDGARYERYRDLGDGLFLEGLRLNRERNGWFFTASGDHLGRLDQRLFGGVVLPGKFKGQIMWDQIPMLLSRTTSTMFVHEAPGVLRIPDLIQTQVQGQPSLITSVVGQFSRPFDMKTRRYVLEGGVEYLASPNLTFRQNVRNTDRKGDIPFGGSFGQSSFVETPQPIDHRITDLDGNVEYARGNALFRAGYTVSSFRNDVTSLVFDNPYRLTDTATASSNGRLALPPGNTALGVNGMFSYRLPRRTRVTGYLSTSSLKDVGDPIIPMTINTALPVVALDRSTVNGSARMNNLNLAFTSRPSKYISVDVRYKYYDYDNQTPEFFITQRVAYDAALQSPPEPTSTEPFSVLRRTFDADLRYSPVTAMSAGIGFTQIGEERTHRIFESTTDNVARLVFDSVGNRWFTLRAKFEHAERRGTGIEQGEVELAAIGEQRGMRHFDIADRDRNRVTLLGTTTPIENVSMSLSVASGEDDYLNSVFGLLDNRHRVYTIGSDLAPSERVTLGVSYAYEDYRALSRSRQANPGVQFDDPSRNWSTNGQDRVHSVMASAEVREIAEKFDVRMSYDLTRARTLYRYGVGPIVDRTLPEETDVIASALPPPTQLPAVFSETQRGSLDFVYSLTQKLDLGFTYWYDQYRVSDFTLDAEANPTLDRGNALLLGYVYRPYTANTFFGRLIWHW